MNRRTIKRPDRHTYVLGCTVRGRPGMLEAARCKALLLHTCLASSWTNLTRSDSRQWSQFQATLSAAEQCKICRDQFSRRPGLQTADQRSMCPPSLGCNSSLYHGYCCISLNVCSQFLVACVHRILDLPESFWLVTAVAVAHFSFTAGSMVADNKVCPNIFIFCLSSIVIVISLLLDKYVCQLWITRPGPHRCCATATRSLPPAKDNSGNLCTDIT